MLNLVGDRGASLGTVLPSATAAAIPALRAFRPPSTPGRSGSSRRLQEVASCFVFDEDVAVLVNDLVVVAAEGILRVVCGMPSSRCIHFASAKLEGSRGVIEALHRAGIFSLIRSISACGSPIPSIGLRRQQGL